MWKNILLISLSIFLFKCKTPNIYSKNNTLGISVIDDKILKTKRFCPVVGIIYGYPKQITHTSKNDYNKEITKYNFQFKKEKTYNCIYTYSNNKLLDVEYYNNKNQLDSVISEKIKTYYYYSSFEDYSPRYSVIKGKIVDSIKYTFDIPNRKKDYYYNNQKSVTTYYDSIGRKAKTYSYDSKFYTYYKYNDYGYLKEEYSCKENTKVKFKSISNCYEYDESNNWIKKITQIKYKNRMDVLTIIKDRKIKYN